MNNLTVRRTSAMILCVMLLMVLFAVPVFATEAEGDTGNTGGMFDTIVEPIVGMIESLRAPALAIVGAIGSLYCILLGVKYAKAEEPQDREKAKNHLKSAIIGFVLIFVLMLALSLGVPILTEWVATNS